MAKPNATAPERRDRGFDAAISTPEGSHSPAFEEAAQDLLDMSAEYRRRADDLEAFLEDVKRRCAAVAEPSCTSGLPGGACACSFAALPWHDRLLRIEDDPWAMLLLVESIECADVDSPDGADDVPLFVSEHNHWREPVAVSTIASLIRDANEMWRRATTRVAL